MPARTVTARRAVLRWLVMPAVLTRSRPGWARWCPRRALWRTWP